ncbi:MAG: alpha/beta fold hydrolase [Xanthomonadales bacterium]|nr:alpha/beta fold hydrolase [Xanthomonadales bacterium]
MTRSPLRKATTRWLKRLAAWLTAAGVGVVVTAIAGYIYLLDQRPDLGPWHHADLDLEFDRRSPIDTLEQYLALEDELFEQLEREVYDRTPPGDGKAVNRYRRGALADPRRWPRNWNRTFILEQARPDAIVLLLHGLSDSPYSLRTLGRRLHEAGALVVGLRIPGHGTAPSGLVETRWQDMAAAVEMALRDLDRQHPGLPLHVVGYSNGAALALHAALKALEDDTLPLPDRLVLLSPEIQVTALAKFAVWQARLGHWLGVEKLAWNDILVEYDPFKYGSFAVNAGDLSYRLTAEVQEQLTRLGEGDVLGRMPPILAFSSVVDATVNAPALVTRLFNPLPRGDHELVLFDINRQADLDGLLTSDPQTTLDAIALISDHDYDITVVSNTAPGSPEVAAFDLDTAGMSEAGVDLGLAWPRDVFSLSHVALPFDVADSLYGATPTPPSPGVQIGRATLRGERGVLHISEAAMLRQRWNPFYSYLEARTLDFLGMDGTEAAVQALP